MAEQAGLGQGPKYVIDGLMGYVSDPFANPLNHRVGICVGVFANRLEHGNPLAGHPESVLAEDRFGVDGAGDDRDDNPFLESIQSPPEWLEPLSGAAAAP